MGLFDKLAQSSDLVSGMADRLGVDFGSRIAHNPEEEAAKYRRAVMRCSTCDNQAGCVDLQGSTDHLDDTPSYCRNADLFHQIR